MAHIENRGCSKSYYPNSRHSYEEVVWKQDVETFIHCHERAFRPIQGDFIVNQEIQLSHRKSALSGYKEEENPQLALIEEHEMSRETGNYQKYLDLLY